MDDPEIAALHAIVACIEPFEPDARRRMTEYLARRFGAWPSPQSKAGVARAESLSPSRRSGIASKAANARWNKPRVSP